MLPCLPGAIPSSPLWPLVCFLLPVCSLFPSGLILVYYLFSVLRYRHCPSDYSSARSSSLIALCSPPAASCLFVFSTWNFHLPPRPRCMGLSPPNTIPTRYDPRRPADPRSLAYCTPNLPTVPAYAPIHLSYLSRRSLSLIRAVQTYPPTYLPPTIFFFPARRIRLPHRTRTRLRCHISTMRLDSS
jgi:hypothetical protein